MKIKLDENLPASLVNVLAQLGYDVDSVPAEHLGGRDDPTVWSAAQAAQRFLITQDLDFSDIRRFAPGTHAGILLIRIRSPGRLALAGRVESIFKAEAVDTWAGCFVVATDQKVRIRRP